METLDAQCLLVRTVGADIAPDSWRHDRAGSLSCAYGPGGRMMTWSPQDVAEMARKWRDGDASVPDVIAPFVEAHRRTAELVEQGRLRAADAIVHDVLRAELRFMWDDEKLVVIVEDVPVRL